MTWHVAVFVAYRVTTALMALRVEIAELRELGQTLVDRRLMLMRMLIEVLSAHVAEAIAVRSAEGRERRRQYELLAQQRRQIDLEVRADRLGVRRRLAQRLARDDTEPRVVLLREVRVHRSFDRHQAPAADRLELRVGRALEIRAGVRMRRDDIRVDRDGARLEQPGVLAMWIDRRLSDAKVGLRADRLLQQRRDAHDHVTTPRSVAVCAPR